MTDEHDDGYRGPAEITVGERTFALRVWLGGYFQPVDGFYHWYGRVAADERLTELVGGGTAAATLSTPHGRAPGRLGDVDLWNRYRIEGISTPPFPVHRALADPRGDGYHDGP